MVANVVLVKLQLSDGVVGRGGEVETVANERGAGFRKTSIQLVRVTF